MHYTLFHFITNFNLKLYLSLYRLLFHHYVMPQ
jgi:hypothetical protein